MIADSHKILVLYLNLDCCMRLLNGDEDGDEEEEETDRLCLQFGKKGSTALVEAAKLGHLEVVKLLLSHGANVNSTVQVSQTHGNFGGAFMQKRKDTCHQCESNSYITGTWVT